MNPALSRTDRLTIILEMLRAVSRQTDPNLASFEFSSRYWRLRHFDFFLSLSTRGLDKGQYKITRRRSVQQILADIDRGGPAQNPWAEWSSNPVLTGGFLGEIIAKAEPQLFRNLRLTNDPVVGDLLAEMGSCIAVPLYDSGEPLNWALTFRREPDGLDEEDLEESLMVGNLVGTSTRNLVAANEVRRLNATLRAQFDEVARVQQSLLPAAHPEIPGLKLATSYLPSDVAGGDYYDFFELPGGRWGILIADASGHGVGAATVMAMLHAILHAYDGLAHGPAAVMQYANKRLTAARMDGAFVTGVFATYDPATHRLSYARAGHPAPLVKDGRSGAVYPLEGAATLPMGITDDYDVAEASVTLRPGDTVVMYTDGITEAFAPGTKSMFGTAGMIDAMLHCSGDPDCIVDSIHSALYKFTGVRTRADDQTLVALQVSAPARG
ncbi:MAG: serine/threonine-protein phosphatase [Phycisphaeraceae bacterium]|nr:serine/threonine-protein phosphatase [Phycisphaeraceae bacterium]